MAAWVGPSGKRPTGWQTIGCFWLFVSRLQRLHRFAAPSKGWALACDFSHLIAGFTKSGCRAKKIMDGEELI
jgi:hypothetical protein